MKVLNMSQAAEATGLARQSLMSALKRGTLASLTMPDLAKYAKEHAERKAVRNAARLARAKKLKARVDQERW